MKVGDLVRHTGYGTVGWKMGGKIGVVKCRHYGNWQVHWINPSSPWEMDVCYCLAELEVIGVTR